MEPFPDLEEVEGRSRRYWSMDGLPELMMGAMWIFWGAALLIGQSLPKNWLWGVYWLATPAVLCLSGFATIWATKRLKARLTFPRTGYVEWKEPGWGVHLAAALVALAAAAALAALIVTGRTGGMEQVTAPGVGLLLCLAFLVASLKQKAPHLLALSAAALTLGLAFGAARMGWNAINWMFLTLGGASAVLGGIRLALFLRKHPLAAAEEP